MRRRQQHARRYLRGKQVTFEQWTKVLSICGALIVGGAAAFTYYDTANRELEKPVNDMRLSLCKEATDAAATLAIFVPQPEKNPMLSTDKIEDPWRLARVRFEQLYWGSLAIVEDRDVEDKMVKFRADFVRHEDDIRDNKLNVGLRAFLLQSVLDLSRACRGLVSKSWRLQLPILEGKAPGAP